ncbi:MAG TPA: glycosyltransferase [Thermoanaerobaculia bacterium]|nr:glycosyltransferase [Thermoanaerobaculia bacterium]
MRILFPYLARARAANWSRYQQLLAARARAGDEVTLLEPPARRSDETNYRDVDIPLPAGFRTEEVRVFRPFWEARLPFDKIVKKGAYSLAANRRARAIARTARPDVLLVYNVTQESLLDYPAAVVFDVADDLPAMLRVEGGILGPALAIAARRALSRMIRGAALVTTPSRVLLPRLGEKAAFVPNGVDPEEIGSAREAAARNAAGEAARNAAGEAARNASIGFLGSFEYFIDFDLVLELAARLPGRRFVLIGGGRRLAEVRGRVERKRLGNVELTGPLPHGEALARLAGCAFSLCPFTRDAVGDGASPLKLFESLALAVPAVATRTAEIRAERAANVLFADDAEEAAAAIAAAEARPPGEGRAESEAAAAEVLRERSWDRIGEAWAARVRGLIPTARA